MANSVGVLAVMDDRIEQARSRNGCRSDKPEPIGITEFREARAAVAELIEADDRFDRAHRAWEDARFLGEDYSVGQMQKIAAEYEDATMCRIDALARVKGVQS